MQTLAAFVCISYKKTIKIKLFKKKKLINLVITSCACVFYQMNFTSNASIRFVYEWVEKAQLEVLLGRSVTCTQSISYSCQNAPITGKCNHVVIIHAFLQKWFQC